MADTTTNENPIHWQSAFWGLAAIAFNTAIQDSGEVLGFSPKYRMVLKASPIYCLFDTIDTLVGFVFHCRYFTPRQALQLLGRTRTTDEPVSREKNFAQWLLSWAGLILALLQVIKLFSFRGVPWTQVFAAFYFTSFVVQETINQLGRPKPARSTNTTTTLPIHSSRPEWAFANWEFVDKDRWGRIENIHDVGIKTSAFAGRFLPLTLQIVLWAWLTGVTYPYADDRAVSEEFHTDGYLLLSITIANLIVSMFPILPIYIIWVVVLVIFGNVAIILTITAVAGPGLLTGYVIMYVFTHLLDLAGIKVSDGQRAISRIAIGITLIVVQFRALRPIYTLYILGVFENWPDIFYAPVGILQELYVDKIILPFGFQLTCGCCIVGTAAFISWKGLRLATRFQLISRPQATSSNWAASFLVLANIASALFYYSVHYSEDGTFKPEWAENLG